MSMIRFDGSFAHESMSPEGWILPFVRNHGFVHLFLSKVFNDFREGHLVTRLLGMLDF